MDSATLDVKELRAKHYNGVVTSIRKAHSDLMIFRVKRDEPFPEYKAGQYTALGLGYWEPRLPDCGQDDLDEKKILKVAKRAYSISHPILSDSGELFDDSNRDFLEFYVVLVRPDEENPAPVLTPRLFMLEEGDRLNVGKGIVGHFNLDSLKSSTTTVILGSTGTGEAPHNHMIHRLLSDGFAGQIVSLVCCRYNQDLGYLDQHRQLEERYPNYHYIPLSTREPETINNKVYIQDFLASERIEDVIQGPLDPNTTDVYLCGNPDMIGVPEIDKESEERTYPKRQGVIEILEKRGFRMDYKKFVGNIHFENYW